MTSIRFLINSRKISIRVLFDVFSFQITEEMKRKKGSLKIHEEKCIRVKRKDVQITDLIVK